jgi:hypothetical protein
LLAVDHIIAPRKTEKYMLQNNTMAHFANEHKSRVIEHHQKLLDRYILDDNDEGHRRGSEENKREEVKQDQFEVVTQSVAFGFRESKVPEKQATQAENKQKPQKEEDNIEGGDEDEEVIDMPMIEEDSD